MSKIINSILLVVFTMGLCLSVSAEDGLPANIDEIEEIVSSEEFEDPVVSATKVVNEAKEEELSAELQAIIDEALVSEEFEDAPVEAMATTTVETTTETMTEKIEEEVVEMAPVETEKAVEMATETILETTEEVVEITPAETEVPKKKIMKKSKPAAVLADAVTEGLLVEEKNIIREASLVEYGISSGFYKFSNDCAMRADAALGGKIVGVIRQGKTLWVDDKGEGWITVYRTSGPAYVDQDCL